MSLTDKCAVTGIGETEYSRNSGKSVVALQMEASLKAIAAAGLKPNDIDGVIPFYDVLYHHFSAADAHVVGNVHYFHYDVRSCITAYRSYHIWYISMLHKTMP